MIDARRALGAILLAAFMVPGARGQVPAEQPSTSSTSMHARLTDDVIKEAVRQALAELPKERQSHRDGVLGADTYQKFARDFSEAQVPDCLRPDALKHQPTSIETKNWVIGVSGIFALPFWAAAVARGKCH
jgi:hypothetical protein